MSTPNAKKMLEELGAHFKVPRDGRNIPDWSKAVKKAAGKEYASIEMLYTDFKKAPPVVTKPSEPAKQDGASVANTTNSVHNRAVPAAPTASKTEAVSSISEGAVAVHVHPPQAVQAQVVEFPTRDWFGLASIVASRCQTLALGIMMGVLISKPVLRVLGYS